MIAPPVSPYHPEPTVLPMTFKPGGQGPSGVATFSGPAGVHAVWMACEEDAMALMRYMALSMGTARRASAEALAVYMRGAMTQALKDHHGQS